MKRIGDLKVGEYYIHPAYYTPLSYRNLLFRIEHDNTTKAYASSGWVCSSFQKWPNEGSLFSHNVFVTPIDPCKLCDDCFRSKVNLPDCECWIPNYHDPD